MDLERVLNFQISKSARIYRLLGVSFCFSAFICFNASAETACSQCYAVKRPACEKRCKSSVTRIAFSSCADSCVASSCNQSCQTGDAKTVDTKSSDSTGLGSEGYVDPTLSEGFLFHEVGGECGKCLRRATARSCGERCPVEGVEDLSACRKNCAKLVCSSSCQLPNESDETEKRPTVRDCGECKRVSEMACHADCDKLKDQPGYTTCVVSCVEDKCFPACNPD